MSLKRSLKSDMKIVKKSSPLEPLQVSFFSHQTVQITMPWGTVAVQKSKQCHSLIEDIEIPAADSALGARFKINVQRLIL